MPRSITVLLIDDDPAQCETLADILADHHCRVDACSDPRRGEALGRSQRFDLVLLDLKMDGLDGLELLRRIHPPSLLLKQLRQKSRHWNWHGGWRQARRCRCSDT